MVCFGGFWTGGRIVDPTVVTRELLSPSSRFRAVAMGVHRGVLATPGEVLYNIDVTLDIPLRSTVRVRFGNVPVEETNFTFLETSLTLGDDGVIQMPTVPCGAGARMSDARARFGR